MAVVLVLSSLLGVGVAGVSSASARPLAPPKSIVASADSASSISVSFSPVPGAESYTVFLYGATGKSSQPYLNAVATGTRIDGLTECTTYRVSVQAISSSPTAVRSIESGKVAVTTRCLPPSRWIGNGDFTVELWVKPTVGWSGLGRQELFAIQPTSYNARLDVAYESGKWWVISFNSLTTEWPPTADPAPSTGSWTHVALTRQSGTMRLYVGGTKISEFAQGAADLSLLNQLLLGADPNAAGCRCNLATARLSNVRVVDGTALYTGATLTVPTSALTAIPGTTFLLDNVIGGAGSVVLDGATRYEQTISTVDGAPALSPFSGYSLIGGSWSSSTVVTDPDSPFAR